MTNKDDDKKLLLKIEMWDCGEKGIMADYLLPVINDDYWIEFYQNFFEALCLEIANIPGAEKLMGVLDLPKEEDNGEGEDKS